MTIDDTIRAIMREVIREELAVIAPIKPNKALLTRAELAEALGYSLSTVARFAKDGCPVIDRYGGAPRFEEVDRGLHQVDAAGLLIDPC